MSLTYGFYDSDDGDRKYDSRQISKIFDGLISDGVYQNYLDGMMVSIVSEDDPEDESADLTNWGLVIKPGRAWFNHTWNYNDGDYRIDSETIGIPMSGDRYIAVALDINLPLRVNKYVILEGDPVSDSTTPPKPTPIRDDVNGHYQYILAYLYQNRAVLEVPEYTKLENAIGTEETPFVSNVLSPSVDISDLLKQWTASYDLWTEKEKLVFQSKLDELYAELFVYQEETANQIKNWYQNLTVQINENAAVNLQNQIGSLDDLKTGNKENLVGAINDVSFIGAKWGGNFKPVLYCGLELFSEETVRLHIPKLVNLSMVVSGDDYLQPGDVLYCQIFKGDRFESKKCMPKTLIIMDKNENVVSGSAKYLSNRYIRYDKSQLYTLPSLDVDPPTIYNEGNDGSPQILNRNGGFTILVYQGILNGVPIFSDYVNDSYSIVDTISKKSGETKEYLDSLVSLKGVRECLTNSIGQHAYFTGFIPGVVSGESLRVPMPIGTLCLIVVLGAKQDPTGATTGNFVGANLRLKYANIAPTASVITYTDFALHATGTHPYSITHLTGVSDPCGFEVKTTGVGTYLSIKVYNIA